MSLGQDRDSKHISEGGKGKVLPDSAIIYPWFDIYRPSFACYHEKSETEPMAISMLMEAPRSERGAYNRVGL